MSASSPTRRHLDTAMAAATSRSDRATSAKVTGPEMIDPLTAFEEAAAAERVTAVKAAPRQQLVHRVTDVVSHRSREGDRYLAHALHPPTQLEHVVVTDITVLE